MGEFIKVERFHCRRCDYITEDPDRIKMIRELRGKCPACQDGEGKGWTINYKNKIKLLR